MLLQFAQMEGVLFGLAGQRLELRFQRIDPGGEIGDGGRGIRPLAGYLVGRDFPAGKGRGAAGKDLPLHRAHFLFQPVDALGHRRILRDRGRRGRNGKRRRTHKNDGIILHMPIGPHAS